MSTPDRQDDAETRKVDERTTTIVRRIGYVLFMGGGLLLFIPMLVGVAVGISEGEVWDPFTEERVDPEAGAADCEEDARHLIAEAGQLDSFESAWDERHSAWVDKCRDDHPELYDLLRDSRRDLQG